MRFLVLVTGLLISGYSWAGCNPCVCGYGGDTPPPDCYYERIRKEAEREAAAPPRGWPRQPETVLVETSRESCLSRGAHPGESAKPTGTDDGVIYNSSGSRVGYARFWPNNGRPYGTCEYIYN